MIHKYTVKLPKGETQVVYGEDVQLTDGHLFIYVFPKEDDWQTIAILSPGSWKAIYRDLPARTVS